MRCKTPRLAIQGYILTLAEMLILGLSSYLLDILNDANMLLSEILIGC